MDIVRELATAIDRADLDRIEALCERHFYRLLLQGPALMDRAMASLPAEWTSKHPRRELWQAATRAIRSDTLIPTPVLERFAAFVRHDAGARPADALILLHVRLTELMALGWGERTSFVVDEVHVTVAEAGDRTGLSDLLPLLFTLGAIARMLSNEEPAAIEALFEAAYWVDVEGGHPARPYVDAHMALWHAMEERYGDAAGLLGDPPPRQPEGTLAYRYQGVGFVVRALIAVGDLDAGAARRWLAMVDVPRATAELGWLVLHVEARIAMLERDPWQMIHAVGTMLDVSHARFPPSSFAGAVLRADLAHLLQIAGDLRAAERVLATPGLRPGTLFVEAARARQALMRGRPAETRSILQHPVRDGCAVADFPSGVVLAASAELAATGEAAEATVSRVVEVVVAQNARDALTEATPPLRALLAQRAGVETGDVLQLWRCEDRPRFTRREQQLLRALQTHTTIPEIARMLYIPNETAAASLKVLFKKLGAHTREEALWLAGE